MTILEIIITVLHCWPMCVHVTVAMNTVCAGEQYTRETCVQNFMHDIVRSLGTAISQGDESAIDIAIWRNQCDP